jgi:hypothetical protein
MIKGCDFHTRYQQIAMLDEATGELTERRLEHQTGEAESFHRSLQGPVRVGIEATGPIRWFERLLTELGHELWIGDSAKIRASEVRKQKTDERDAWLILDLLLAKRFPRIWVPTPEERDLRQLLWHRHKLVCLRTMLGNQLHALAMSEGLCRKKKLFTKKGPAELAHPCTPPKGTPLIFRVADPAAFESSGFRRYTFGHHGAAHPQITSASAYWFCPNAQLLPPSLRVTFRRKLKYETADTSKPRKPAHSATHGGGANV